jgi:hypothetical protein
MQRGLSSSPTFPFLHVRDLVPVIASLEFCLTVRLDNAVSPILSADGVARPHIPVSICNGVGRARGRLDAR